MEKGKLALILEYSGLGILIFVLILLLTLPEILPQFFYNNSEEVFSIVMLGIFISFAIMIAGGMLLRSVYADAQGKVFVVKDVKDDRHRGYIYNQGAKIKAYSSDELSDGDHVKIISSEKIFMGRYSTTILMCKKLGLEDPEYNNLADSKKETGIF